MIELLEAYGVEIVSGIPGTHTIELYRGLANSKLRHVTPRHEQGAGFIADGYARITGKPAACITVSGPGALNIATAMGQALADSIPMLVISADNKTHHLGLGEGRLHETPDLQAAMAQCSRWSHTLASVGQLPGVIARAFAIFQSERPGPVHISIPLDIITGDASHIDGTAQALPQPPQPHANSIEEAAKRINEAARPVIAAGGGAVSAAKPVQALAEKIGAPVTTTQNAKGLLCPDHPLLVGGCPAQDPIQALYGGADLVVAIGTELAETDYDFFFNQDSQIPKNLVRFDIDPRQFSRNDVPALAVLGDAGQAIDALLPLVEVKENNDGARRTQQTRKQLTTEAHPGYQKLFETLVDTLPDLVIMGDSTQPTYFAALQYDAPSPRSFTAASTGFGTLGLALPAAIGAKLAAPDRPVVVLVGDGGLQFTINELSTAIEAQVGITIVLWNNQCYGEIAQNFRDAGMDPIACHIHTPDFIGIAKAYGCYAESVTNHDQLAAALRAAQTRNIPSLIELPEERFISHK